MADVAEISRALGVEASPGPAGTPRWWCHDISPTQHDTARRFGLRAVRRLHQMRVPLPLAPPADTTERLATRPFRAGLDDADWLAVNNRAFSWHPDQGGWTHVELRERIEADWFEADGFRVAELDGRLAGFCWTKYHAHHEPPMGEIYVIAVDPDFVGRGLGRALAVAGLDWQWQAHRPPLGMLYVEADNVAAVSLYLSLGFVVHHDDVAFELADAA